jgi:flagellar hook-associated protein 1 FlgK
VTVSIGTGQPLVVGKKAFSWRSPPRRPTSSRWKSATSPAPRFTRCRTTPSRGGELGGLLEFRAAALDRAQNSLGQMAAGLAATFNAQHVLGQDLNGDPGGNFFEADQRLHRRDNRNAPATDRRDDGHIVDASKLTTSDYNAQASTAPITTSRA